MMQFLEDVRRIHGKKNINLLGSLGSIWGGSIPFGYPGYRTAITELHTSLLAWRVTRFWKEELLVEKAYMLFD